MPHIMARAMQLWLLSLTCIKENALPLPAHTDRAGNSQVRRKGAIMFCNGCNNNSILWLIILIIILFGYGGNGCGCGCGNYGCGCGCGCDNSNNCGCGC